MIKFAMFKNLFRILNILLITVIIFFSVKAFYKIAALKLDGMYFSTQDEPQQSSREDEIFHPFSYYDAIIKRDLFNTKETKEFREREKVDIENLRQTELDLTLWGTVTGERSRAYAVIEEKKTRKQNLYKTGDTVQNATVKIILRKKIVLDVNGADEILELEENKSGKLSLKPSMISRKSPTQNITLKSSQIENAVKNPDSFIKQIKFRQHFINGKSDGLILSGINRTSLFRKMGLRNGDVITGIDGETIESANDVLALYERLKSSSTVALQIKRTGRNKTINYTIE